MVEGPVWIPKPVLAVVTYFDAFAIFDAFLCKIPRSQRLVASKMASASKNDGIGVAHGHEQAPIRDAFGVS
jgi:hypothetical protein